MPVVRKVSHLTPLRIFDPALLTLGVAASSKTFLEHRAVGPFEPPINLLELAPILDLNPEVLDAATFNPHIHLLELATILDLNHEVLDASGGATRDDGEVDARSLHHPLGGVGLDYGRLCGEQMRANSNRGLEVLDGHVDM